MGQLDDLGLRNDPNLVAYWKMEGDSTDDTGTHNGTDSVMVYDNPSGKYGQGAAFNGISSKIALTDAAGLKQTGDLTIAAWVKPASVAGGQMCIFQSYNESASPNGMQLDIEADDTFHFITTTNPGSQSARTEPGFVKIEQWYHVVGVRTGTTNYLYVNGVRYFGQTVSVAPAYNATNFVRIGCRTTTAGGDTLFYSGDIDEVCLFSRALSSVEIQMLARDLLKRDNRLRPAIFTPGTAK